MKRLSIYIWFFLISIIFGCQTPGTMTRGGDVYQGENQASDSSSDVPSWLQKVTDALADAAVESIEDKIDSVSGKYDGEIVAVTIQENTYERIIFDVAYKGVEAPSEILIGAEALKNGFALTEYYAHPIQLSLNSGTFQLIMYCPSDYMPDCQYNCQKNSNNPDHIRFFLLRSDNPNKQFGQKIISLNYTNSNNDGRYYSENSDWQSGSQSDYHSYDQNSGIYDQDQTDQQGYNSDYASGTQSEYYNDNQNNTQNQNSGNHETNNTVSVWHFPQKNSTGTESLPNNQVSSSNIPTGTKTHTVQTSKIPVALIQNIKFEFGIDRPGKDIKSFEMKTADPKICRQECFNDGACKAFTYVKPGIQGPKARCWLKNSVPDARKNAGCISGIVRP